MQNFEFSLPTKVYFGKNKITNIKNHLKDYNKILITYGGGSVKKYGIMDDVKKVLKNNDIDYEEFGGIQSNPKIKNVRKGIDFIKKNEIDFILAVGGGSVIDSSKAMACGVYSENDVWDYFTGKEEIKKAIPLGVVLTLAATGSEMNINSVLINEKTKQKMAIHSRHVLPKFAVLDPTYTMSVPPYYTACGVSDIMAHTFEQYFSWNKEAEVSDRLSESILDVCIKNGPIAYENGEDYIARSNLLWSSTLALNGLLSLGKQTDWASHKIAHELSAHYGIAHGATLSIIFPAWMEYVLTDKTRWKFDQFGRNVWGVEGKNEDVAEQSIALLRDFFESMDLPIYLEDVDVSDKKFEIMAKNIEEVYGEIGNFKKLNYKDIIKIYKIAHKR